MATRTLRTPPLQPSTGTICGEAYLAADVGSVLWGRLPCASDTPVLSIAPGTTVTVEGEGVTDSAPTDEAGRAIFAALGVGKTLVASVTVDGETVRSAPFQVPAAGGLRVILAVGLDGATPAAPPT